MAPLICKVEETVVAPVTLKVPPMLLLALAMNPLVSVAKLLTPMVLLRVVAPFTMRVVEALSGPATVNGPTRVLLALARNPPVSVANPLTNRDVEAFKAPNTVSPAVTVDEAWEIKPPVVVTKVVVTVLNWNLPLLSETGI